MYTHIYRLIALLQETWWALKRKIITAKIKGNALGTDWSYFAIVANNNGPSISTATAPLGHHFSTIHQKIRNTTHSPRSESFPTNRIGQIAAIWVMRSHWFGYWFLDYWFLGYRMSRWMYLSSGSRSSTGILVRFDDVGSTTTSRRHEGSMWDCQELIGTKQTNKQTNKNGSTIPEVILV
jgi:hypothetical protein